MLRLGLEGLALGLECCDLDLQTSGLGLGLAISGLDLEPAVIVNIPAVCDGRLLKVLQRSRLPSCPREICSSLSFSTNVVLRWWFNVY